MKRILAAAAMMAVLVAPAASQMGNQGKHKTPLDLQYEREAQEQKANESAYNEQMKRLKSQNPTAKTDPWAGVRPANDANAKR
jgi:hypothetical protein